MVLRPPKVMLLFRGVPDLPSVEAASGCVAHRVDCAMNATQAMATLAPEFLVICGETAWQRDFVKRLPASERPPVIVIGGGPEVAALADEWLAVTPHESEAGIRLQLAKARAWERRRISRRALVDPLTGLPNRRALIATLVREAARARRAGTEVALVLVDLDDFKKVNERWGHAGGDRMLRRVGAALRGVVRDDEVFGRTGGDEFALVLGGGCAEAEAAAERVQQSLQRVGISATTAACVLQTNEQLRELYRRTDERLFQAKERRHRDRSLPVASREFPSHPSGRAQTGEFIGSPQGHGGV